MTVLALHHCYDGLFMVRSNDGVALPMTYLLTLLNMSGALTQKPTVRDLAPAVPSTSVALSLLLLAPQVFLQASTETLVGIDVLLKGLVTQ